MQLVLVGTLLEVTCFLGEIPTGIVADLYSRRLSVLIGLVLIGTGIVLQGALPVFWAVLLAQIVWGIGYTFTSGATEAWITDEIGEGNVQPVFTRAEQLGLAMTFTGTIAAGGLGIVDLRLPIVLAGIGYVVLAGVLVLVMPEGNFHRTPRDEWETFAHMRRSFTDGLAQVHRRPVVRSFFLISLLVGLSSEVFDRLWAARLIEEFTFPSVFGTDSSAVWFALIVLIGTLVSLLVSLVVNRVGTKTVNDLHPNALLAVLVLIQVAGVLGLALLGNLWLALAAIWVRDAARVVAYPIQAAWLNRNVDSRSRATVLSMNSQTDALGQVVGGPPLGALATRTSIPVALIVSAGILAPAAAIYARLRPPSPTRDPSADN